MTPSGEVKNIRAIGHAIRDASGGVTGLFGTAQDITQQKRAEQELEGSRDQLRALTARLQSVREEERTTVAREIHDELGAGLTAVKST